MTVDPPRLAVIFPKPHFHGTTLSGMEVSDDSISTRESRGGFIKRA
jgi:hypothetical protein